MRKKVLIFSTVFYPRFIGGAEVAVKEITDRLGTDFEFDMVTLRVDSSQPTRERIGNIDIYRIGFAFRAGSLLYGINLKIQKYLFPFLSRNKAASLYKSREYDFIWAIMASFAGFGASFFKKSFPEIPFILTLQEGDPLEEIEKKVGIFRPAFLNIFKRADILQAISKFLGVWGKENGFKGKPIIIPNGVDLTVFDLFQKKDLDFPFNYVHLVTVSRLVRKNGIEDIIKALSFLPDSPSIKYKLIIFGSGPLEKELNDLVKEYKLIERVQFFGQKSHGDIVSFFQKQINVLQIFVRPSLSEGLGNSFLEAMAFGMPVIATPVGGITDFLKDKETGLFCNVNDPKSIADKVMEYVENFESRRKIVENAKKMVKENYDWNKIAQRMKREVFN